MSNKIPNPDCVFGTNEHFWKCSCLIKSSSNLLCLCRDPHVFHFSFSVHVSLVLANPLDALHVRSLVLFEQVRITNEAPSVQLQWRTCELRKDISRLDPTKKNNIFFPFLSFLWLMVSPSAWNDIWHSLSILNLRYYGAVQCEENIYKLKLCRETNS